MMILGGIRVRGSAAVNPEAYAIVSPAGNIITIGLMSELAGVCVAPRNDLVLSEEVYLRLVKDPNLLRVKVLPDVGWTSFWLRDASLS
jgi:hypothetical protein